jgi:type I restriction enzyme M protein
MAKNAKTQEQSLESIIWNCRNALRGTVGGNEKNRDAFYLGETSRWSYIVTDDIAVILGKAMADIEDRNPPLKGALPQNFYATLGARKERLKDLR